MSKFEFESGFALAFVIDEMLANGWKNGIDYQIDGLILTSLRADLVSDTWFEANGGKRIS